MNLTRHNYEEYFLRYVDGELAADERLEVEAFLEEHPDLFEEMDSLHMTVLPQDEVFAFDKNLLYRYTPEERPVSVVPFTRWRLSAAVAVVIALGTSAALWIARDRGYLHTDGPSIALVRPGKSTPTGVAAETGATPGASGTTTTKTTPDGSTPTGTPSDVTPGSSRADVASTAAAAPTGATPSSITRTKEVPRGRSVISAPGETPYRDTPPNLQATSSSDLASAHPAIDVNPRLHDLTAPQHPQANPLAGMQTTANTVASKENNPATSVTTTTPVSYHTLEDGDKEADGDKILFVRADQVVNGEVKGFFRRAGRLLKRSTSLTNDNVRPDSDR